MTWKTIFHSSALLALLLAAQPALAAEPAKEPQNYAQGAVEMGWIAFRRDDLDRALEYFSRAIKLDPKWGGGYYGKACAYSKLEEFELAFDYYRKTIELAPDLARVYNDYAVALISAQRPAEALPLLQKALQLEPENGKTHANLALSYYFARQYAKSWQHVHQAQKLKEPLNEDFLHSLRARMPDPRLDV